MMQGKELLQQLAQALDAMEALGAQEDRALAEKDLGAFDALAKQRAQWQKRLEAVLTQLQQFSQNDDQWEKLTARERAALIERIIQQQQADVQRLARLQALIDVGHWLMQVACEPSFEEGYGPRGGR